MKYLAIILPLFMTLQARAAIDLGQAFEGVSEQRPACFARRYSGPHFLRHPKQTVESIKIKLTKDRYDQTAEPMSMLHIQIKRRGENMLWTNSMMCFTNEETHTVSCPVECDGGSVEILSRDSAGVLWLKNNGVLLYGGCGDGEVEKPIFLESHPGGDDVFRLQKVDERICSDVSA